MSTNDATHSNIEKNNIFTERVTTHNIGHCESSYLHANNTNITEGGIYEVGPCSVPICASKKHVEDIKVSEKVKAETLGEDPCEGPTVATLAKAVEL